MKTEMKFSSFRNFIIVWIGQFVSAMGSSMTSFALEIWVWEFTDQVTTLTLVGFYTLLPSIVITPISGVIVDRWNRKLLMIVGDSVAVGITIAIALLYLTNHLQVWHLYITGAITGIFNQLQSLAYSASVGLMIPPKHYSRASSMEFLSTYGAKIMAPAFAGYLYHVVGLVGISLIDILTFSFAIISVLLIHIPQPPSTEVHSQHPENIWQELGFGWRYIQTHKSLLALLMTGMLFWFFHDVGGAVYTPMILARSGNNTLLLGSLASAAGIGGVMGALIMSAWGGSKHRVKGFLWGMVGAGLSKTIFGLGNTAFVWIGAQFCSSLNFPLNGSSENAIWLSKVTPEVQGRVFAVRSLLFQIFSAIAYLIAGPLADKVFEPAMKANGQLAWLFGNIFGINKGAGMALLYVLCALCMLLVGAFGFNVRLLRNIDENH
ncbi:MULTISPECIES: MFS transporter [unclassified Nostoc]|uniref:MFS transporter n=1 Tax=unclassified Nostoc TaxID=2593658 RepID=UPI002AD4C5D6|nr:MFS transporter [Nostoc sp. DedQUE03]MDZ7975479.1 MFS transporter [Nostoc sp. DedQUE03]MDZ8045528.1 MFS transporter [Nostoc sp. DedQUE02]